MLEAQHDLRGEPVPVQRIQKGHQGGACAEDGTIKQEGVLKNFHGTSL